MILGALLGIEALPWIDRPPTGWTLAAIGPPAAVLLLHAHFARRLWPHLW